MNKKTSLKSLIPKSQRKKLITAILSLLVAVGLWLATSQGWMSTESESAVSTVQQTNPNLYRVSSLVDGDTIIVDMNGMMERVRFIGVDTPETQDPRKPVQCFGKAASEFTKSLIGSNYVRLEADPLNSDRDRYNRLLRYVYLPDGRLVNSEIIRQGYGFAYTSFPFSKADEFRDYERQAREQNLGLWRACELTPDQYGGFTPNAEVSR